jgi:hypothetical protein
MPILATTAERMLGKRGMQGIKPIGAGYGRVYMRPLNTVTLFRHKGSKKRYTILILTSTFAFWWAKLYISTNKEEGKALIEEGLSRLKDLKAQGCCLVGHPEYYKQFGFENVSGLVHEGVPPEVFFALSFDGHSPQGDVNFHEAFKPDGPQTSAIMR